jgi:GT2 family glycosyltransferase
MLHIAPAMPDIDGIDAEPTWAQAVWVGAVDDSTDSAALVLDEAQGFGRARLLIRSGVVPRGFVDVAIDAGRPDADALDAAIADLPAAGPAPAQPDPLPAVTVVICTRDRPDSLRRALRSVVEVDYPTLEIVVVDNNPRTGTAQAVADQLADPRIRVVPAPIAGLSRARNVGLLAATSPLVAYTDDDVVVDRNWIRGLVAGFAVAPDVACVTGLVPTGALRTPVHAYFDERVSWSAQLSPDLFRASERRDDLPMFPFCVGRFGTGANFAFRRADLIALGGFDEALGAGAATGGGEDIDMFLRILLSGRALAFEPSSIVWHRHRDDTAGLSSQVYTYGTGLGATMTIHALKPATAWRLAKAAIAGTRHIWTTTGAAEKAVTFDGSSELAGRERRGVLAGPVTLVRARLSGARRRPVRQGRT